MPDRISVAQHVWDAVKTNFRRMMRFDDHDERWLSELLAELRGLVKDCPDAMKLLAKRVPHCPGFPKRIYIGSGWEHERRGDRMVRMAGKIDRLQFWANGVLRAIPKNVADFPRWARYVGGEVPSKLPAHLLKVYTPEWATRQANRIIDVAAGLGIVGIVPRPTGPIAHGELWNIIDKLIVAANGGIPATAKQRQGSPKGTDGIPDKAAAPTALQQLRQIAWNAQQDQNHRDHILRILAEVGIAVPKRATLETRHLAAWLGIPLDRIKPGLPYEEIELAAMQFVGRHGAIMKVATTMTVTQFAAKHGKSESCVRRWCERNDRPLGATKDSAGAWEIPAAAKPPKHTKTPRPRKAKLTEAAVWVCPKCDREAESRSVPTCTNPNCNRCKMTRQSIPAMPIR